MKSVVRCFATVLILLSVAESIRAEAWPRGKGDFYLHLAAGHTESDTMYDPSGQRIPFPGRDTEETRLALYVELGLSDRWTLVASLPYKELQTRGLVSEFNTHGLADLDIRMRHSWRALRGFVAIEAGATVPLGYDMNDFPQLGSGETDWILNAAYGASVPQLPEGFVSLDLGYRVRGGDIADEVPWALKLGAFPWKRTSFYSREGGRAARTSMQSIRASACSLPIRNVSPAESSSMFDSRRAST